MHPRPGRPNSAATPRSGHGGFAPFRPAPRAAWPLRRINPIVARAPHRHTSGSRKRRKTASHPKRLPLRTRNTEHATPLPRPSPSSIVPLRLVGVVGRLYVVLESDRGLVLLDQHAAHERILFEQMLNRLEQQGSASSQKLLLPETVELSVRDAHFLREQLPNLTRMGVGLSEFGERTFLLDALPPFVKVSDSRRFVLELVDELKAAGQEVNSLRLRASTPLPRPSAATPSRPTTPSPAANSKTWSATSAAAPCPTPAPTAAPPSSR